MASLSYRKPTFNAAPHDSCCAYVPDKMGILYFSTAELYLKTKYINEVDNKCVNIQFPCLVFLQ